MSESDPSAVEPDAVVGGAGESGPVERPEVVGDRPDEEDELPPAVSEPAKVMRVGSMIKELLEEARNSDLDEPSRERLKDIYDTSVAELSGALSEDLREELQRLALPFDSDAPSEAELRVAKAQLVGWLEGLFHGIQATLFAQQMAARQQLENIRGSLPPGAVPPQGPEGAPTDAVDRPGTYL